MRRNTGQSRGAASFADAIQAPWIGPHGTEAAAPPLGPLLSVRGLTVWMGSTLEGERRVLDETCLDIGPGEAVGLLGASGCGKSTLARAVLGVLPKAARVAGGAALYRGVDLLGLGEPTLNSIRGAEISMVFQEPALSLNPFRRARDQVADVIAAHVGGSPLRQREATEAVLLDVDLAASRLAGAYPHELSGGQRQRLALAVALACRPSLLLADEPTSFLDTVHQAEILTLLCELRERYRLALLFISHDPACLARVADRIAVMEEGRIVEEGAVARIFEEPRHEVTRALLTWAADAG